MVEWDYALYALFFFDQEKTKKKTIEAIDCKDVRTKKVEITHKLNETKAFS